MTQIEDLAQELQALIKKSEQLVYSVDEAAALLDCTRKSIEDRLRDGRLPGVKFGRSWVLPAQAFIQHINTQAIADAADKRAGRAKLHSDLGAAAEMLGHLQPRRGRRKEPPSLDGPHIVLGDLKKSAR